MICICVITHIQRQLPTHRVFRRVFGFVRPYSCPGITETFLCGEKHPEYKADNPPSSVETKKKGGLPPLPHVSL